MELIAHKSEDGRIQPFAEHANNVAKLAADFASEFGSEESARLAGLLHDIGKCSPAGQRRLTENAEKVEHAAAGAEVLGSDRNKNPYGALLSYCVAGHHTGLPDGGVPTDTEERATLYAKLRRQAKRNRDYMPYQDVLPDVPAVVPRFSLENTRPKLAFGVVFRTRMLFSCLVDADFLDTEAFMDDAPLRASLGEPLGVLYERLQKTLSSFGTPKDNVAEKRSEVQRDCLRAAELPRGLFTLTVPTGGGKTLSSLAFALKHALQNGLRRVIYVIPYTSIIDQTAAIFRDALGAENVLEHHHNVDYDTSEDQETDPRALASENWDAPVVVTTNVQFFESLYSNRTSRCRKLHNIANSVLIFDEAQMLPRELLLPCVRAIEELVRNHRCTAVLCSATQPALQRYFDAALPSREIISAPDALYQALRRVRFSNLGQLADEELIQRIQQHEQALCIVNTKLQAQALFMGLTGEGNYHLTTLMTPTHRRQTLAEIRDRLKEHLPCRVISTSLVEAGVDVDFPVVYREEAGLDSAIQAAGRCNREGRRPNDDSFVYLFQPEAAYLSKRPPSLHLPADVAQIVQRQFTDISSLAAIQQYFTLLFPLMGDSLDKKQIVKRLEAGVAAGLSIPFAEIARDFRVIESPARTVIIPNDGSESSAMQQILAALRFGARSASLLRKASLHAVSVYTDQFELLRAAGALEILDEELAVLCDTSLYSDGTGLSIPKNGIALFT